MPDDARCLEECWTRANDELEFAIPVQTAFQEWCDVFGQSGAPTLAQAYLFRDELDYPVSGEVYTQDELETLERFAIFGSHQEQPFTIDRIGAHRSVSGIQLIHMERLIAEANRNTAAKRKTQRERSEYLIGRLACQLDAYFDVYNDEPGSGRHIITQIQVATALHETRSEYVNAEGLWHKGSILIAWGEQGQ